MTCNKMNITRYALVNKLHIRITYSTMECRSTASARCHQSCSTKDFYCRQDYDNS